jgi:ribosomal protein L32
VLEAESSNVILTTGREVPNTMKCDNCGRLLLKNENVCPYCGTVHGPSRRNQAIVVVLVITVGVLAWLLLV